MSSKLLKPDIKSTRNATEMLIPNMAGITVGEMDRLKLNTGWLNNILGEHLLLVQRLRWLLLAEFCIGLSKGITISVGMTILMRFLLSAQTKTFQQKTQFLHHQAKDDYIPQ